QISGNSRKGEPTQIRPGRASKAVDNPKERLMQGRSMEQRANAPVSSRATTRKPAATRTTRSKSTAASGTRGASKTGKSSNGTNTRKTATPKANRPKSATASTRPADPHDIHFIQWANEKWRALEPHHQQRVFSVCLLILSLLLLGSL